jgi:hypothetical protein
MARELVRLALIIIGLPGMILAERNYLICMKY